MTSSKPDKLTRLRQRKAHLEKQIAAAESAAKAEARKLDTRRKVLVGAAVLAELETDPGLRATVRAMLGRRITRANDRAAVADLLDGEASG